MSSSAVQVNISCYKYDKNCFYLTCAVAVLSVLEVHSLLKKNKKNNHCTQQKIFGFNANVFDLRIIWLNTAKLNPLEPIAVQDSSL